MSEFESNIDIQENHLLIGVKTIVSKGGCFSPIFHYLNYVLVRANMFLLWCVLITNIHIRVHSFLIRVKKSICGCSVPDFITSISYLYGCLYDFCGGFG